MVVMQNPVGEDTLQFLEQHGDNTTKLELLFFWSRHPHARFSLKAIARALETNSRVSDVGQALEALTTAGLVDKHIESEGLYFYSLAAERARKEPVLELSKCSLYEFKRCLARGLGASLSRQRKLSGGKGSARGCSAASISTK